MLTRMFPQTVLAAVVSTGLLIGCGRNAEENPQQTGGPPASGGSGEHADPHDVPLTEEEIASYREARGMGLARPADINGYPGPLHVLEQAEALGLSDDQRAAI